MSRAMVITVVGDLSGRPPASAPRAFPVDRDDFEDVLRSLAPRLDLGLPFCGSADFAKSEDFRPDALVENVPELRPLLEAREAVADPARMRRLLEAAGVVAPPAVPPTEKAERRTLPPDGAELLRDMLEEHERKHAPPPPPSGLATIDRRIREIIESSADPTDHVALDRRRDVVDAEIAARVRAILRHPRFLRLEATWISLRKLVRGVETGEQLRIRAVDVPSGAETSPAAAALVAGNPDEPTTLVVSDAILTTDDDGFAALQRLAALARHLDVPVIAGWDAVASPPEQLPDDPRWAAIRSAPGADRLGLCTPRLLLRLPYGADTDPTERFRFEEDATPDDLATFVWGSPAFVLAVAAAQAWTVDGTLARLDRFTEIGGLPQYATRGKDGIRGVGPVEMELPEPRVEAWKDAGLIPVTGVRGRDVARILSLRSLTGRPLFAGG